MRGSTRAGVVALLAAVAWAGGAAVGQQRGSKLFPDIFDDTEVPPSSQPSPAPGPATAPALPTATTTRPTTVPARPVAVSPPVAVPAPGSTAAIQPSRLNVPPPDRLAGSRKLMREVFAAQLADRSPAGRQKLVERLVREAAGVRDNPVDRYVLLTATLQAARDTGDLPTLVEAADQLGGEYAVDALAIKADVAGKTVARADPPAAAADNVRVGMALVDELVARAEFAGAAQVLQAILPAANATPAGRTLHAQRSKDVAALRDLSDQAAQASTKLAVAPNDPDALFAVGSFTCYVRGNWDAGLPMLARGSNPLAKAAATADLAAEQAKAYEAAGDAWWALAERESVARYQQAMRGRAGRWYESALRTGTATGLARVKLERRVAETAAASPAAAPAEPPPAGTAIKVPAGHQWVQTDFKLTEGRCYEIVARGRWTDARGTAVGPAGSAPPQFQGVFGPQGKHSKEEREQHFVGQSPRGALIARVENDKPGFFVGAGQVFVAPASTTLALRMNDGDNPAAERRGQLDVSVREVTPRFADARGETKIVARIDTADTLCLAREGVYWIHTGGHGRVGEHGGYYPTTLNGVLWWPKWVAKDRTAPLPGTGLVPQGKVTIVRVEPGRGDVTLEASGPGEARLKFDDKGLGSASVGCVIAVGR